MSDQIHRSPASPNESRPDRGMAYSTKSSQSVGEGVSDAPEIPDPDDLSNVRTWVVEDAGKTFTVSRKTPVLAGHYQGRIHTARCHILKRDDIGTIRYAYKHQIADSDECVFCKRKHGDGDESFGGREYDGGRTELRFNVDEIDTSEVFDSETAQNDESTTADESDYLWSDEL